MTGGPRRWGGLLRQREFRLLWIGETTSSVGNSITKVALPLVAVTALRASTLTVSVLYAAAWLPWLLLVLPAGAWVDRLPGAVCCSPATWSPCWRWPASRSPPGAGC
jgi:Transmembrane secretion effector